MFEGREGSDLSSYIIKYHFCLQMVPFLHLFCSLLSFLRFVRVPSLYLGSFEIGLSATKCLGFDVPTPK